MGFFVLIVGVAITQLVIRMVVKLIVVGTAYTIIGLIEFIFVYIFAVIISNFTVIDGAYPIFVTDADGIINVITVQVAAIAITICSILFIDHHYCKQFYLFNLNYLCIVNIKQIYILKKLQMIKADQSSEVKQHQQHNDQDANDEKDKQLQLKQFIKQLQSKYQQYIEDHHDQNMHRQQLEEKEQSETERKHSKLIRKIKSNTKQLEDINKYVRANTFSRLVNMVKLKGQTKKMATSQIPYRYQPITNAKKPFLLNQNQNQGRIVQVNCNHQHGFNDKINNISNDNSIASKQQKQECISEVKQENKEKKINIQNIMHRKSKSAQKLNINILAVNQTNSQALNNQPQNGHNPLQVQNDIVSNEQHFKQQNHNHQYNIKSKSQLQHSLKSINFYQKRNSNFKINTHGTLFMRYSNNKQSTINHQQMPAMLKSSSFHKQNQKNSRIRYTEHLQQSKERIMKNKLKLIQSQTNFKLQKKIKENIQLMEKQKQLNDLFEKRKAEQLQKEKILEKKKQQKRFIHQSKQIKINILKNFKKQYSSEEKRYNQSKNQQTQLNMTYQRFLKEKKALEKHELLIYKFKFLKGINGQDFEESNPQDELRRQRTQHSLRTISTVKNYNIQNQQL